MIIALSGGFDPIHKGHVDMIEACAERGRVHIYLNSDEWLKRKKGFIFMPFEDRAAILWAIKGVEMVLQVLDTDDTVCETLRKFKPNVFANGGDRKSDNTPEVQVCNELGIQLMWNMGGDKIESSSALVERAVEAKIEQHKDVIKQW